MRGGSRGWSYAGEPPPPPPPTPPKTRKARAGAPPRQSGDPDSNQGPFELQSNALPLSYPRERGCDNAVTTSPQNINTPNTIPRGSAGIARAPCSISSTRAPLVPPRARQMPLVAALAARARARPRPLVAARARRAPSRGPGRARWRATARALARRPRGSARARAPRPVRRGRRLGLDLIDLDAADADEGVSTARARAREAAHARASGAARGRGERQHHDGRKTCSRARRGRRRVPSEGADGHRASVTSCR